MAFTLKKTENAFQVTAEGPFEYKTFRHGEVYESVPESEAHRFDEILPEGGE